MGTIPALIRATILPMTDRPESDPDDAAEPVPSGDDLDEALEDDSVPIAAPDDEVFAYESESKDDAEVVDSTDEADEKRIGIEPDETDSEQPEELDEPITTRSVDDRPLVPIGLILALALAVLLVFFAIQNTQMVEVNLFSWSWEAPLILALIGAFIAAVIVDEALGLWVRRRRRRRREAREELERLRRADTSS
ncbi:MAG: DUF1049 domain-containing protein [Acidimicrobiia bacterium]|nr:DUF1049 domain-containing protein [Acidimicrobiia bacterium]